MLRSLYARFAVATLALFVVIGALAVTAFEHVLDESRVPELASILVVGGVSFGLLAGLLSFRLLTRRLSSLAGAIETFRENGFRDPAPIPRGDPRGDEIDRLGATVRQMAERMATQLAELEQGHTRRRELLANVSHDLRTPLTSMQGYLEMLLLKQDSLPPEEERACIEIAARHSERLGRLIGDLFQLTKLEADEVHPSPEPFSIGELLQDIGQKFQLKAERKEIRIEVRGWEVPAQVSGDIALVERLIENLIENAIRYTPPRGIVRLEAQVSAAGGVTVSVSDTGQGISPDELPRLFERYYRAPRHGPDGAEGTGLGLAIARRIALLHGSDLKVTSTPAAGTTMRFELPMAA